MATWKKVVVSGSNAELNTLRATSVTASLFGTASYAVNALTSLSSSFATTASYALNAGGSQLATGSFATTGSNTFVGNQIVSGSLRGNVIPLTIASSTASIDCSLGNFFTLTLAGGGLNTRLVASNIQPGETITLLVTQNTTTGSLTYPSYFKFPNFGAYTATASPNAKDILTFVTLDSTTLYGVNVKNMI